MIPILYPINGLAPPAVVTTTGAAAGFPARRLYDGDVGLLWTDSAAGTRDVLIDLGTARAMDTVLFAAGHTLAGLTVDWASGPASGTLTSRVSFTVGAGTHRQTLPAPQTDRWWRLRITAPSVAPAIPEVVLSLAVPFPSSPILRGQDLGQVANVVDLESYGGYAWGLARGPVRWTATYPLVAMTRAQRDALLAAHQALDGGARHCYLTDGEGVTRWVSWMDRALRFAGQLPDRYDVTLTFREVLGPP